MGPPGSGQGHAGQAPGREVPHPADLDRRHPARGGRERLADRRTRQGDHGQGRPRPRRGRDRDRARAARPRGLQDRLRARRLSAHAEAGGRRSTGSWSTTGARPLRVLALAASRTRSCASASWRAARAAPTTPKRRPRKRLEVYKRDTQPVLDHYRDQLAPDRRRRHAWTRSPDAPARRARSGAVIQLKSKRELDKMREAGRHVGEILVRLTELAKPGVTTGGSRSRRAGRDQARAVSRRRSSATRRARRRRSRRVICASVNEEIVHGIPGGRRLVEGDLLKLDFGAICDGFHADAALTRRDRAGRRRVRAG